MQVTSNINTYNSNSAFSSWQSEFIQIKYIEKVTGEDKMRGQTANDVKYEQTVIHLVSQKFNFASFSAFRIASRTHCTLLYSSPYNEPHLTAVSPRTPDYNVVWLCTIYTSVTSKICISA